MRTIRLMIYDKTCTGRRFSPGLTHSWIAGGLLYAGLGRFDAVKGVSSWGEALDWLGETRPDHMIHEVQYWGHGQWGNARIDGEILSSASLSPSHPHHAGLSRIRERMDPEGQWWFRTCETFGAQGGHTFAQRFTAFLGCAAAGHTHIIGPWQSGLHRLSPGDQPHWSAAEGLKAGSPDEPKAAAWSRPGRPNTIHCLRGTVPRGW